MNVIFGIEGAQLAACYDNTSQWNLTLVQVYLQPVHIQVEYFQYGNVRNVEYSRQDIGFYKSKC